MRAVPADAQQLQVLCDYAFQRIGARLNPMMTAGFAVLKDSGEFAATVLVSNLRYHNGKAIDCEVTCISETPMAWRPHVCTAIFTYIFGQLGCRRCTSIVRKNNTKSREFLQALNFQLEGNIRCGYDGEKDALVYGLLREECDFFTGI